MKFAHIADCHVGSWRDSKMKEINLQSFSKTIDLILEENNKSKIDILIIAGDLFNTAVPSIDALKIVFEKLKLVQENDISICGVAGSHDYSVAGKSMLEVLGKAKLFTNLMKGEIVNKKLQLDFTKISDTSLTGIVGKKGTLEKEYYNSLDYETLENMGGNKIFVFHTAIEEFIPEDLTNMESASLALLPKNFTYYAGGHVHYRFIKQTLGGTICFPGPTCPNNFKEWLDLDCGSFVIGEINEGQVKVEQRFVEIKKTKKIIIKFTDLTPLELETKIKNEIIDVEDKIVLLKIVGTLESGSVSDINFEEIIKLCDEMGAYTILRNTSGLNTPDMDVEDVEVKDIEDIEIELMNEVITESKLRDIKEGEVSIENQKNFITNMTSLLAYEKEEGETNTDFEDRLEKEFEGVVNGIN